MNTRPSAILPLHLKDRHAGDSDSLFTEITTGEAREGDAAIVGIASAEDSAQEKLPPGFEFGPKIR